MWNGISYIYSHILSVGLNIGKKKFFYDIFYKFQFLTCMKTKATLDGQRDENNVFFCLNKYVNISKVSEYALVLYDRNTNIY